MFFTDRASIEGAHRTGAGYLAADVRVARTGIQVYSGHEVGKPEMPTVRVWRPDKQVFAHGAMASAAHKPVTIGHPAQMVDSTNWKREAVGWTGDQVARDGEFLKIPMLLADQSAIDAVQNGTKEISCGYSSELHWGAGTTPTGEAYDAVQREISSRSCRRAAPARNAASAIAQIRRSYAMRPDCRPCLSMRTPARRSS